MNKTTKAVVVLLGSYNLNPDDIEPMVVTALHAAGYEKLGHMRVIPEGTKMLARWAERPVEPNSDVDDARLTIYPSREYNGPINRNNLAINGQAKAEKSHKGKAHVIIQLGSVPPHNLEKGIASTQETLLNWWQDVDPKKRPKLVQVGRIGDNLTAPAFKAIVEPKSWVVHGETRTELTAPPKKGGSGVNLAKRSSDFWASLK